MSGSHRPPTPRRSPSRRGMILAAGVTVIVLVGGALAYFAIFPQHAPAFVRTTLERVGIADDYVAPPPCPLTGVAAPDGVVPERPALAVKVDNLPEARPHAGLQSADVVYEEPVEGGITRFVAVYQCNDVPRVGPVRSARTADPDVLAQLGVPVLAYSGAATSVVRVVEAADLVPIDETDGGDSFTRDPNRASPHNLYVDTKAVYRVAHAGKQAPAPLFTYEDELAGPARKASMIHLPFHVSYADVYWSWNRRAGAWTRSNGDDPHVDETGETISATNVVVQVVSAEVPAGSLTPRLELVGSGKAFVLRDGRVIVGRWERDSLDDITRFTDKDGREIALAPGRTWVELFPSHLAVELSR